MRKSRLRTLALPVVLSALSISSCIADGDTTLAPSGSDTAGAGRSDATSAGNTSDGGFAGVADDVSGGGGDTPERGGSSGRGGSGPRGGSSENSGGSAGEAPPGGQAGAAENGGAPSAGGAHAGGEAHGGAGGSGPPLLDLCSRLPNPTQRAFNVTEDYWAATTADCRISWVSRLYPPEEVQTFLNRLLRWNRAFWGCLGTEPPETFGLLYTEVPITSKDAEVLIDIYMGIADTHLDLSSNEAGVMLAGLSYLAERVIAGDSNELSNSSCADDTSDDGGEP